MLFILEGLDRTGKTSLAQARANHPEHRYLHFSAPKQHPVEEYVRPLLGYDPNKVEEWWVDRHYLGELVWPKIFGRPSQFDRHMALFIELFLASRGAVPVYAWRDTSSLIQACANEPVADKVAEAKYEFMRATMASWLDWTTYKHGETHHGQLISQGYWAKKAVRTLHAVTWRWIGNPSPEYILVGEQVNQPKESAGLPFIPYNGRSGHFLMRALDTPYLGDRRVAMINALDPDGKPEMLHDFWLEAGRPPVVALGNKAAKELSKQVVPHEKVYHPQYWKRFHAKAGHRVYAKMIREAAEL